MNEVIFKGNLKDFLDSKKADIIKLVRFGIIDENILFNEFQITHPTVNFDSPVDITRINYNSSNTAIYIFKFSISGDTDILNYKPSTSFIAMPEWIIRGNEIWFQIEETDLESMKIIIDGLIENFRSHLLDISEDIREYNNVLRTDVQKIINLYNNRINDNNKIVEEIRNYLLFRD